MVSHIDKLTIIWTIFSALVVILAAVVIVLTLGMLVGGSIGIPEIMLACICALIGAAGIIGFRAAGALKERKPWARTTIIVLSALNILQFPIGTAIGVYSLVVLFDVDVVEAFNDAPYANVVS